MSDIRKELKLVAKLDDSEFKQQLQKLRKELGNDISLGNQDLGELKQSFQAIAKDFAAKIKEALSEVKSVRGAMGGSSGGRAGGMGAIVRRPRAFEDPFQQQDEVIKRESEKKLAADFKIETKKEAAEKKRLAKEEQDRLRLEQKIANQKLREDQRVQKEFDKLREQATTDKQRSEATKDKESAARIAKQEGGGTGGGGIGSMAKGALAAGGAVSALTFGTINIMKTMAERANRSILDLNAGNIVEEMSRQSGRSSILAKLGGAVGGAALGAGAGAAAGSFIPGIGTGIGAAIGGIGGGIKGFMSGSNAAGELSVEETRVLGEAFQQARGVSPLRQQAMAGGGMSRGGLNAMQGAGANLGFTPEQTMQNFLTARGTLGNAGAQGAMQGLQERQRFLGVDVGTGAQGIEAMAGAGGTTRSTAAAQQAEVIKKGVAAGLDVSKSGKFLQTVSQFVTETAGVGRVDVESATSNLALAARGIAQGADITDTTLQQAMAIEQRTKAESTATEGIAGIGNFMAVQKALPGASTEQMMAALKLSNNAKPEDAAAALGVDLDTAKNLMAAKKQQGGLFGGLETLGFKGNEGLGIGAFERNQPTEELLAEKRARESKLQGFAPGEMETAGGKMGAAQAGVAAMPEFKMDVEQAKRLNTMVLTGLDTFDVGVKRLDQELGNLVKALETGVQKLNKMSDNLGIRRQQ